MFKNTNTNITVEKIDTTESIKQESKKESKKESKQESKQESKKESKKYHQETLDDLSLKLSSVSENIDYNIHTDNLFDKPKKKSSKTKIKLHFKKNINLDQNKYKIINKYIKKNIESIKDLLFKENLIKNKNIPYRILFHIYVNYLNEDLNIIFE